MIALVASACSNVLVATTFDRLTFRGVQPSEYVQYCIVNERERELGSSN